MIHLINFMGKKDILFKTNGRRDLTHSPQVILLPPIWSKLNSQEVIFLGISIFFLHPNVVLKCTYGVSWIPVLFKLIQTSPYIMMQLISKLGPNFNQLLLSKSVGLGGIKMLEVGRVWTHTRNTNSTHKQNEVYSKT